MNNIGFDLKSFIGDKLNMSEMEFANLIGVSHDDILRMEDNPSEITIDVLVKIANKTGQTLDELLSYKKPAAKALHVANNWKQAEMTKRTIIDYIANYSVGFKEASGTNYTKYITELQTAIEKVIRKPKIALVGRSDVGKSSLINSLLGAKKMPASWTPTTSIVVYIKHIDDRPKFINEDVVIFKSGNKNTEWDDSRLLDESYCLEWQLATGDIGLLSSYGTRQGDHYSQSEAGSAVVFVDSDLLKNCDILDVPGYGTGDSKADDKMSLNAKQKADILIYLSLANGFMREEDLSYLREAINMLPAIENRENDIDPLANLFIVASQAHTVDGGNLTSLNNILDKGCERFERTITDNFWNQREKMTGRKYSHDIFRSRFFTYTTDIEHVRKDFEENLKQVIELLPNQIDKNAKEFILKYAKDAGVRLDEEIASFEKLVAEKIHYEKSLAEVKKKEKSHEEKNKQLRKKVSQDISEYTSTSVKAFEEKFNQIISTSNIVDIIDARGYKKKKEDVQLLSTYLTALIEEELQNVLQEKSEKFSKDIEKYITDYQKDLDFLIDSNINFKTSLFDAKGAFIAGLTGVATYGGLALWASTFGNLGGYILVTKGVSLLSAMGISVGGTAAATTLVAGIGGPVVLGIALAVVSALGAFAIFSGGWKKTLAKKIVSAYEEQDALKQYKTTIYSFWKDTESAFNTAADNMEKGWKDYIKELNKLVNNYDVKDIKARIEKANDIQNFLQNIPL